MVPSSSREIYWSEGHKLPEAEVKYGFVIFWCGDAEHAGDAVLNFDMSQNIKFFVAGNSKFIEQ